MDAENKISAENRIRADNRDEEKATGHIGNNIWNKSTIDNNITVEDLKEFNSDLKHQSGAERRAREEQKADDNDDITLNDLVDLLKNYLYLIIICAAVFLSYYPILDNDFVWDDQAFIITNENIKSLKNIPSFFIHDVEGLYRPMRTLFYSMSYALFGLKPFYYHLQAIVIHLIATILIYYILLKITDSRFISFSASLIFAIHPAHTESIAFITSSFDQIAIIFLLLSYYYYLKTSRLGKLYSMDWYYLSLSFFAIATFSSEMALTLPLIIVLYDLIFVENTYKNLKGKIRYYMPYFVILVSYLIIRFFLIGVIARYSPPDIYTYFLGIITFTKVMAVYLKVLILPTSLAIERVVPLAGSFLELAVLISIFIIMTLGAVAYYFKEKNKLVTFSIILFFITLLPVSNIIPIQRFISEAYLYLPLLSFAIIAAIIINYLLRAITEKRKALAVFIMILLVVPYTLATIKRNDVWQNEFTLWSHTVKDSPYSSKAHSNFALILQQNKKYDDALQHYLISLQLNPYREGVYFNLATLYEQIRQFDNAVKAYNNSISVNPNFADAHNNLGLLYSKLNQSELALKHLKISLVLQPSNAKFHLNLGSHYNSVNQLNLALQEFKESLKLNPNIAEAHYNIGIIYIKQNRYEDAEYEMEQALAINPKLLQARLALEDLKKVKR